MLKKQSLKIRRQARIRSKISGTIDRPRLVVNRSNTMTSAQLIDDESGRTLASVDTRSIKSGTGIEKAKKIGIEIAEKTKALKIDTIVFDRGGYIYHGKVRAVAEGAREAGLKF